MLMAGNTAAGQAESSLVQRNIAYIPNERSREQWPSTRDQSERESMQFEWQQTSTAGLNSILVLQVSVMHGSVIRGDLNNIKIGFFSSVQENCVIHAAR